jgi:hypothetical protein
MEDSDFTGALWCAALPGLAQETAPESPQDYAWGRSLTTTASSPWYRVALPDDVYQQSVWPDLRDVRVFNHQGERVPFTLQVQQEAQPAPKEQALRLFLLPLHLLKSCQTPENGSGCVPGRLRNQA